MEAWDLKLYVDHGSIECGHLDGITRSGTSAAPVGVYRGGGAVLEPISGIAEAELTDSLVFLGLEEPSVHAAGLLKDSTEKDHSA